LLSKLSLQVSRSGRIEYYDVSLNQDAWAGFVVKLEEGWEFPVPLEAPEAYTEPVLRISVSDDTLGSASQPD